MLKSTKRFIELYEKLGVKFEIVDDVLWREYQKMVVPLGPAKLDYSITEDEAKYLLLKFSKALLVRWTDGFKLTDGNIQRLFLKAEDNSEEGWYAVICTEFKDLGELSAKNRSEIRRGLKNCEVKKLDADYIAKNGFNVFISAFERYNKGVKKPSITEREYKERILKLKGFEDIIHFWGVFYKGRLIAYSENYVYDNIEANYSTIKFHPDFLKLYPSYALIYEMNKYYLKENKFRYVNDGFRNIMHQTNVQKYLIDKFKFRKEYTNLYAYYKPYLSIYLSQCYIPYEKFFEGNSPKIRCIVYDGGN